MTPATEDLWLYPLKVGDKLATNDWIEWHFHSFLESAFVAHMLHKGRRDVIATAGILWSASYRQDPAGTLPDDDIQLAKMAGFGVDVAAWQEQRDLALWGWSHCLVEDPELAEPIRGRLGHRKVIAPVAANSFKRRDGRKAARDAGALAVLKSRIRKKLEEAGKKKLSENPEFITDVAKFLDRANLWCTDENVAAAVESITRVPRVVSIRGGDA